MEKEQIIEDWTIHNKDFCFLEVYDIVLTIRPIEEGF